MKTAISIPNPVYDAAEDLAKRLGISRSELYVRALLEFLRHYRNDEVTQRLNEVYAREDAKLDPILAQLQWQALPKEEW